MQEVARCNGSLQVVRQQGAELRSERDELKDRCDSRSVLPSHSLSAACCCSDPAFALAHCLLSLTAAVCVLHFTTFAYPASVRWAHYPPAHPSSGAPARSLATTKGHLTTCTNRNHALTQSQKRLQESAAEAERRLQQGDAGITARLEAAAEEHAKVLAAAEARHAAAAEQAQQRLAAAEAALAALEKEKAEVANEKKAAEATASKAEAARRDAELARATAEVELRTVRESKEKEIER